jgi:hypothetical protein
MTADEDDFELELPVEAVSGAVTAAGGSDALGDGLLEMIGVVAKFHELLEGVDEDEFRVIGPRLVRFQRAVAALPAAPKSRRRLGFRAPNKKKTTTRKKR